jgi:hypothetical protein
MLLAALIVGGLTAYWLGLQRGLWAAVATFALLLVALFVPALAQPIHVLLAVGVLAVFIVGSKQQRPADAVRATRWVRATVGRVVAIVRAGALGGGMTGRKRNDDRRDPPS